MNVVSSHQCDCHSENLRQSNRSALLRVMRCMPQPTPVAQSPRRSALFLLTRPQYSSDEITFCLFKRPFLSSFPRTMSETVRPAIVRFENSVTKLGRDAELQSCGGRDRDLGRREMLAQIEIGELGDQIPPMGRHRKATGGTLLRARNNNHTGSDEASAIPWIQISTIGGGAKCTQRLGFRPVMDRSPYPKGRCRDPGGTRHLPRPAY